MKTYLHSIGDANKSKVKGSVSISKQKLLSTIGTGNSMKIQSPRYRCFC